MSSLASGLVTALLRLNRSLSRGCSCGSTSTLVQTLLRNEVSRLRTPSCLCATNPPFLHDRAWLTIYFSPQTHLLGKSDRGTLYLKRRESLNSCIIIIIIIMIMIIIIIIIIIISFVVVLFVCFSFFPVYEAAHKQCVNTNQLNSRS